jgi:hypothetical protein
MNCNNMCRKRHFFFLVAVQLRNNKLKMSFGFNGRQKGLKNYFLKWQFLPRKRRMRKGLRDDLRNFFNNFIDHFLLCLAMTPIARLLWDFNTHHTACYSHNAEKKEGEIFKRELISIFLILSLPSISTHISLSV